MSSHFLEKPLHQNCAETVEHPNHRLHVVSVRTKSPSRNQTSPCRRVKLKLKLGPVRVRVKLKLEPTWQEFDRLGSSVYDTDSEEGDCQQGDVDITTETDATVWIELQGVDRMNGRMSTLRRLSQGSDSSKAFTISADGANRDLPLLREFSIAVPEHFEFTRCTIGHENDGDGDGKAPSFITSLWRPEQVTIARTELETDQDEIGRYSQTGRKVWDKTPQWSFIFNNWIGNKRKADEYAEHQNSICMLETQLKLVKKLHERARQRQQQQRQQQRQQQQAATAITAPRTNNAASPRDMRWLTEQGEQTGREH